MHLIVFQFLVWVIFLIPTMTAQGAFSDKVANLAFRTLEAAQVLSFRNNREYCGVIGYDERKILSATKPVMGFLNSCDPGKKPEGWVLVASYHTHARHNQAMDSEVPSLGDMQTVFSDGLDGFIATPGGRFWRISAKDRMAKLLCGPDCIIADPKYRPCRAIEPVGEYTVKSLQQRTRNDDGSC